MNLKQILEAREKTMYDSDEWHKYTAMKTKLLEEIKPSTREKVFYYYSDDIKRLPNGYVPVPKLLPVNLYVGTRSSLEYDAGVTRHVIPYCIVRYNDLFYFTVREGGSEDRLVGKIGLLGGHVGKEGITTGMLRELEEEADITENKIRGFKFKGYIKLDGNPKDPFDVSRDHLGLVHYVVLRRNDIREFEDGILHGVWIHKDNIYKYYDKMEDWSKLLVKKGLFE